MKGFPKSIPVKLSLQQFAALYGGFGGVLPQQKELFPQAKIALNTDVETIQGPRH